MCNRVLLLFWKLPQWNLHVNCHVNGTTFQSGLRFQTGLSSLWVSCKRALIQVFSCKFCDISKTTFSTEHLRETTSDIKFIYVENVVRLVLFVVLLWPPKIWFDRWFFYFSVHGDRQRNNIYLQRCHTVGISQSPLHLELSQSSNHEKD